MHAVSGAAVSASAEVRVRGQRSEIPGDGVGVWGEAKEEGLIARMYGYSVKP